MAQMIKPKQLKVYVAEVFYPQFVGHEMVLFQHRGTNSMTPRGPLLFIVHVFPQCSSLTV